MAENITCDWHRGFIMDPKVHEVCGYLVSLKGLDLGDYLKQDIEVFSPFNNSTVEYKGVTISQDALPFKATVTAIIEKFEYNGGVGDPICISCYMSSENANQLKAKQQSTMTTTKITEMKYWFCDYDPEQKAWFEKAFPRGEEADGDSGLVDGQLNAKNRDVQLSVAELGTKLHPDHDLQVYNVYFELIPAANKTFYLGFAESANTKYVKGWGLKIGDKAGAAM